MKICHLLPTLASGGVEQVVLELCQGLQPMGVESIAVSGGGRMVARVEAAGAKHYTLPIGKKSPRTFLQISKLKKIILSEKPDIVHIHSRVPAWVGQLAVKSIPEEQRPIIISTYHGFYSANKYSEIMTKGKCVIAVSDCAKQHILDNYPSAQDQDIRVIPNTIDPAEFNQDYHPSEEWLKSWYAQFPHLKGQFVLCLPARVTRPKGAAYIVPLLQKLHAKNIPAHALIVGETKKGKEAFRKEVEADIAAKGLSDFVTWGELRQDIKEILSNSNVILSLSLLPESFGKTTLEALTLGRPVAGFEYGGVGEQLNYFLPEGRCPVLDMDYMANTIEKWYHNPPKPVSPTPAIYCRETMIQEHFKLYQEMLNS